METRYFLHRHPKSANRKMKGWFVLQVSYEEFKNNTSSPITKLDNIIN